MSWLTLKPSDGPAWTIRNESVYSDEEVAPVLQFLADRTGGLTGAVTVRLGKARNQGGHYSGQAGSRRLHGLPDWVRSPLYMRLTLSPRDWTGYRRRARVCWHSNTLRKLALETYDQGGEIEDVYAHLDALLDAGETRFGRWPIYHVTDWQEMLVHIAAHEAAHLVQYDRDRGHSEVWCEEFALQILNEYRAARSCGDEPDASAVNGRQTPFRAPLLGLVTGPAIADPSTNRKEPPTVATTTSTEAKPDPKPGKAADSAKAAPAKSASDSDGKQELFDTLLGEITGLADKTAETKRSQYVRVDVLLAEGKKKTLVYLHYPTKKSVRAVVPAKTGSDFDTVAVEKAADIPKAVKVIRNRLAKVTA